ncbi:hypothetical protein BDR04DRAFT_1087961 [Suillus decipiens]|nr:hypothetical protein BDR04DRAFT_1087961 [Suillus decipiens]
MKHVHKTKVGSNAVLSTAGRLTWGRFLLLWYALCPDFFHIFIFDTVASCLCAPINYEDIFDRP